jgi:N-acetylglucosamine malate deacetylase 1
MDYNKKALFIGAHTDDIEIHCGGIIQRFENKKVIAFSSCNESTPKEFDQNITVFEFTKSCEAMKAEGELYKFPVRRFNEHRQEILEMLVIIKKEYNPDIVFTHCFDRHQDHQVINKESIRAFSDVSMLSYGHIIDLRPNFFVSLTNVEFKNKCDYISIYKSQLAKKDILRTAVKSTEYWGAVFNKQYVEPFELIHWHE